MPRMTFANALCAAFLAVMVTGCSHQPLYSKTAANGGVAAELATVSVDEQRTRAGQLLRNELLSSIRSNGNDARFVLKMAVDEKTQQVSSLAYQKTDRHRYRLNVTYQLVDVRSGEEVNRGSSFSAVSYDTVEEPVADLRAAENARERAARELSQDLRLRLSAFLATRSG